LFIRVIQAMMRPFCLQMAGKRDMEKNQQNAIFGPVA
jgi:hypothetical protein